MTSRAILVSKGTSRMFKVGSTRMKLLSRALAVLGCNLMGFRWGFRRGLEGILDGWLSGGRGSTRMKLLSRALAVLGCGLMGFRWGFRRGTRWVIEWGGDGSYWAGRYQCWWLVRDYWDEVEMGDRTSTTVVRRTKKWIDIWIKLLRKLMKDVLE